jgi:hypothetical protein
VHIDDYFEYLLGILGYVGEEMFVTGWFGRCKLALGHDLNVMHPRYKM